MTLNQLLKATLSENRLDVFFRQSRSENNVTVDLMISYGKISKESFLKKKIGPILILQQSLYLLNTNNPKKINIT